MKTADPLVISRVTLECCGEIHAVSLMDHGALVLHDHNDIESERALAALGGELPRCLQVLEDWRRFRVGAVPWQLQPYLRQAEKRHWGRKAQRRKATMDPLTSPLERRLIQRTKVLISQSLQLVNLGVGRVNPFVIVGEDRTPNVAGRYWAFDEDVIVRVEIKPSWIRTVYRRGMAVVDGHVVLDVLGRTKYGQEVLAVRAERQSDECTDIRARRARVMQRKIRWLE